MPSRVSVRGFFSPINGLKIPVDEKSQVSRTSVPPLTGSSS